MGKVFCPNCGEDSVPGTLICPKCNSLIDGQEVAPGLIIDAVVSENDLAQATDPPVLVEPDPPIAAPVVVDPLQTPPAMAKVQPLVHLVLVSVNGERVDSPVPGQIFQVPVRDDLIWIGRNDPTKSPPYIPGIDLSILFAVHLVGEEQPPVSRRQGSLRWMDNGQLRFRTGHRARTWIQCIGHDQPRVLQSNEDIFLQNGDVLIFGHPKGVHVAFRVEFS
jgi:hypothetical protein